MVQKELEMSMGSSRLKIAAWLSVAVLSAGSLVGEAGAQNASGGRFIVNQLSGKCIDVSGAPGMGNGAPILLYDCERSGRNPNGSQTDQLWEFMPQGFIRNKLSGRCLDVSGAPGVANGAALILYDCELSGRNPNGSQTDQQWELRPGGLIRNKLSGRCIDVPGAASTKTGARLQLWDCEVAGGASDQYWRLQ